MIWHCFIVLELKKAVKTQEKFGRKRAVKSDKCGLWKGIVLVVFGEKKTELMARSDKKQVFNWLPFIFIVKGNFFLCTSPSSSCSYLWIAAKLLVEDPNDLRRSNSKTFLSLIASLDNKSSSGLVARLFTTDTTFHTFKSIPDLIIIPFDPLFSQESSLFLSVAPFTHCLKISKKCLMLLQPGGGNQAIWRYI